MSLTEDTASWPSIFTLTIVLFVYSDTMPSGSIIVTSADGGTVSTREINWALTVIG